jgi:hypothetical protein
MPVHMTYAVLNGIFYMEKESKKKLPIMVIIVIIDGNIFVKPTDCFIKKAQIISSIPAKNKDNQ